MQERYKDHQEYGVQLGLSEKQNKIATDVVKLLKVPDLLK